MCEAASRLRTYAARRAYCASAIRLAFFARLLRKRNTACGCAMPPVACGNSRAYAHLFGWASQIKLFSSWHVICIYSNFRRLHHEVIS